MKHQTSRIHQDGALPNPFTRRGLELVTALVHHGRNHTSDGSDFWKKCQSLGMQDRESNMTFLSLSLVKRPQEKGHPSIILLMTIAMTKRCQTEQKFGSRLRYCAQIRETHDREKRGHINMERRKKQRQNARETKHLSSVRGCRHHISSQQHDLICSDLLGTNKRIVSPRGSEKGADPAVLNNFPSSCLCRLNEFLLLVAKLLVAQR